VRVHAERFAELNVESGKLLQARAGAREGVRRDEDDEELKAR
jgi:hypothetical protein